MDHIKHFNQFLIQEYTKYYLLKYLVLHNSPVRHFSN